MYRSYRKMTIKVVIFLYNLYIFGIHLWTVLYTKPCYNESCYKAVVLCLGLCFPLPDPLYRLYWWTETAPMRGNMLLDKYPSKDSDQLAYLSCLISVCCLCEETLVFVYQMSAQYDWSDCVDVQGSFRCTSDWLSGGRRFDPRWIDHEIFSMVILTLLLIQNGHLSITGARMCMAG